MNYIDPFRDDASVSYDDIVYSMGYYRHPTSLMGVTDETYANYDETTTYQVGEYCIIPNLNGIYRCSDADNIDNYPPAFPNVWTFWSPINSYRMLAVDEFIGSVTTGTDVVMEFNFSKATAFALVDIDFEVLLVEVIDNSSGTVVWSETVSGNTYGATSYYEYFYLESTIISRIYRDNLPWLNDATLRFTFTGAMSLGAVVMGIVEELGCTLYGTSMRFEDTSTISKSNVTGFRTVTRYGNIRVLDSKILLDEIDFNTVSRKVESIIGRNVLFVPTDNDVFSEMITIGYFETFDIPATGEVKVQTQSTIIGVM